VAAAPPPSYDRPLPGPISGPPARRAGSIRRTSHLDGTRGQTGGFGGVVAMTGAVRDLRTTTDGAEVVGEASLSLAVDGAGLVARVEHTPADADLAALVGAPIGFGFRGRVKDLLATLAGTPLGLLVDDLNGAPAPAAYAVQRENLLLGIATPTAAADADGEPRRGPHTDICAGWRAGGLPVRERDAGRPSPFVADPPVPPSLDDPDELAWHELPPLRPAQGRRLRRLDVWRAGDGVRLDAMFRDYAVDPDGTERVVHEYGVVATLADPGLEVVEIAADARALPFPTDCPWAAGSAAFLLGEPIGDLRRRVREVSRGPASCTHLNDLFRSLADVAVLVPLIDG